MAARDVKFELKPVTVKSVSKLMGEMKKKKSAGAFYLEKPPWPDHLKGNFLVKIMQQFSHKL